MASNEQHFGNPSDLVEHHAPSVLHELHSPRRRSGGLGAHGRGQTRPRRPSATLRSAARNAESFNRNRDHRVRRMSEDLAILRSHRARTRSVARIQAEQQRQQREQEETALPPEATSPRSGLQDRISSNSNDTLPAKEWRPSIALGSPLWLDGEDLGAIEIADRKVAQTRLWLDYYQGASDFLQTHQEALREREQLDEADETNTKPTSALHSTQTSAIQKRLRHLRVIVQDSHFPPERANIEAAIAGYESGAISYSDSYTLIWVGRIVDRCPDFDSFTVGRRARLARYEAEHGPGWLWYEPPLSGGGGTIRGPTMVIKRAVCLENKAEWRRGTDNMGHYRARMSFRRRKEMVAAAAASSSPFSHQQQQQPHVRPRGPNNTTTTTTKAPPRRSTATKTTIIPQPNTSRPGTTVPDPDGPRIVWDMLLDSGATLPCLFEGDLRRLGINRHTYAAQSSRTIATADSVIESRVYELDVGVCGDGESQLPGSATGIASNSTHFPSPFSPSLVSPHSITPLSPPATDAVAEKPETENHSKQSSDLSDSLACTIPVVFFPGSSSDFSADHHTPDRLSGILPFHICYWSSAPGNFKLWLGETRNDVVGAGRLPGIMRYGGVIGATNETTESRTPPRPRTTTTPKLVVRRASRNQQTPQGTVFGVKLAQDAGRVHWDENVEDLKPGLSGFDFDSVNASTEDVGGLRAKRKRDTAHQTAQRRGSEAKPAKRKVERELRTGDEAAM